MIHLCIHIFGSQYLAPSLEINASFMVKILISIRFKVTVAHESPLIVLNDRVLFR